MATSRKKILFISYDGMTDPLGQSQVIPYLRGLSLNGNKIFLLSCEKKVALSQSKALVHLMLEGVDIEWITLSYTQSPPLLSTLHDIIKLKRAARKIHAKHKIDLVHTRPGIPALVGLWMKKKMGVKFLNDIREFYADSRVEGGMWNIKNPLYKTIYNYFKRKENEELAQSDGIVCLTYAARKILQKWPSFDQTIPLEVIPCSADLALFDPEKICESERAALKNELGLGKNDFIISYLGSIGGWYLIDEMMRFCKVLSEKKPLTKFLFISPHRHEVILAAAAKFDLPSGKIITKKASRLEVPLLLSLSNYSIFFIRPCYSKQSSSPTKHGEIMAMGIPLITNSGVGDVESIVSKYVSGIIINEFTDAAFESASEKILNIENFDIAGIRRGAREFYSLESAIAKYTKIYNRILGD